eukprot:scaffold20605_cov69-Phaeocystis_antarctica.AAC.5
MPESRGTRSGRGKRTNTRASFCKTACLCNCQGRHIASCADRMQGARTARPPPDWSARRVGTPRSVTCERGSGAVRVAVRERIGARALTRVNHLAGFDTSSIMNGHTRVLCRSTSRWRTAILRPSVRSLGFCATSAAHRRAGGMQSRLERAQAGTKKRSASLTFIVREGDVFTRSKSIHGKLYCPESHCSTFRTSLGGPPYAQSRVAQS